MIKIAVATYDREDKLLRKSTQETDQALQALETAIDAANATLEVAIDATSGANATCAEDAVITALDGIQDFAEERFTAMLYTLERLAVKCHKQDLGFAVNACASEIRSRAVIGSER